MDHKKIIENYNTGKKELYSEIRGMLKMIGTAEASRILGVRMPYVSNLKTGRKKVGYQQLLSIRALLSRPDYEQ
jgi:hypothetical protein